MFQQDMLQVLRWAPHSWMKALWNILCVSCMSLITACGDSWSFLSVMQYTTCHNNWCYPFPHLLIFSWNYVLCWALPTTIDVVLIHGLSSYYMWTLLKCWRGKSYNTELFLHTTGVQGTRFSLVCKLKYNCKLLHSFCFLSAIFSLKWQYNLV